MPLMMLESMRPMAGYYNLFNIDFFNPFSFLNLYLNGYFFKWTRLMMKPTVGNRGIYS